MKNAFAFIFTGFFFAWTITSIAYGQFSNSIEKLKTQPSPEKIIPVPKQINVTRDSDFTFRGDIKTKAVRNFIRDYKNVTDAEWFKSPDGLFVVYFTTDSINSTIYYNKEGDFQFMIRYYNEEKLPAEVRHLVKSNYYDFSIYHVSEITCNSKTAWYVTIENKTCWKKIKVEDNEMEIILEMKKS